jgi:hypothetical protein
MNEVIHQHNNSNNGSSKSRQTNLTKYNYMCDECGEAFRSLDEYIEHFKHYHPRSIGTAIT